MSYLGYNGYKEISIGFASYRVVDEDKMLPKQRAWCKHCGRETAKPIAYIAGFGNGSKALALECDKCHDRYAMYVHMFNERYVGRQTKFGFVQPTHGLTPGGFKHASRDVKNKYDRHMKEWEEQHVKDMAKLTGRTEAEYKEMKAGWEAEKTQSHKRIEREMADFRNKMEEDARKKASEERKQLIADGILVYKKGYGLVDTRTGQLYKL